MFIAGEAQNLTLKNQNNYTFGENTKIGLQEISIKLTPYMDEQSNGLSYLINKLKGNSLFAHIKLEKGERSELANLANELL